MSTAPDQSVERLFTAAASLRELVNLFTDRELDDALLDELTTVAQGLSAKISEYGQWDRQAVLEAGLANLDSAEGRRTGFPYRAIAGPANPGAIPMDRNFEESSVSSEVTLQHMHGGAPGRAHGGVLAGIFDELAGAAPRLVGAMSATAQLTINYRAPIPIGEPLKLRVWIHDRDGRKIFVRGDARRDGDVIADIEALFIAIDYNGIDTSGQARH